ncbi:MAG: (2Fe-2S)-binding protein [Phycisphaeraceae bacterium]|nr:(2Fe-2S)-binding protein [Phycisphaerae bacterium]MBX3392005.1 (2Fe-2S)-binding protein [Phycisphaeraceae bacterium]
MPGQVTVIINNEPVRVESGSTVAAALWSRGVRGTRASVLGHPRAAVCGMGTCYECRVVINGVAHERSCMVECRDGMMVRTTPPASAGCEHDNLPPRLPPA